jgi:hypothetical protein
VGFTKPDLPKMNQELHNHQELNQYLLGSLPEAETERFDELSVTDAEFAGALGAAEKDLIDAYVQGELADEVLQQFKSRYLASPAKRARVEFAHAFQVMAEKFQPTRAPEAAATIPDESPAEHKVSERIPAAGVFRFPRLMTHWGLAATALALFLIGGWLLFENTRRPPTTPMIASFVLTPQTRDAGQIRTLSIPAKTGQVAITLELEPNDYPAYRVELLDPSDNRILWGSDQLKASATGNGRALNLRFPVPLLKPQSYLLRVTGVSPAGQTENIGDYPFKL